MNVANHPVSHRDMLNGEKRRRRFYQQVIVVFSKIRRFKHVDVHKEEYDMDNNLEIHTFFGANGKYVDELNQLYEIISVKLSLKIIQIKEDKIKEAVERHCNDLNTNQRRMIDGITEKEIKKINIDRLLIKNNNMEDIKKAIIEHFKNFANSKNRQVEIFDDWINEYIPKIT
ncbi:hypothetical protein RhiirA4_477888 [Rhizophagus irregularis]|uniref:Uncharacterized protein n=1 Tax=Rhizophagus irregularis TaxID=588596 RepID=A0A2I1HDU5_9GLOM|nr:hypothetical protein RhiirA4_477888 [Rhizophagus irregularis]